MLAALTVNQPLGHVFSEPRPYLRHPAILRLADVTTDFSEYAVMAGAAAVGLQVAHRRLGAIADVAAPLMAFARAYIAAHYRWDVLRGLLFGGLAAGLGWLALKARLTWLANRLRALPGRRSLFAAPAPLKLAIDTPARPVLDSAR